MSESAEPAEMTPVQPLGFKPRRTLLVVLLCVFALWLGFLIFLSATT